MKSRAASFLLVTLTSLFLLSCSSSTVATPIASGGSSIPVQNVTIIGEPFKETKVETQRTNNCDGLSPKYTIERSLAQEQTTTFEVQVGAGALVKGVPIPGILEVQLNAEVQASLNRSLGLSYQQKIAFEVITEPGTKREHTIEWRDVKVTGVLNVAFPEGIAEVLFQKTIGIELYDRTSVPLSCNGRPISTTVPDVIVSTNTPEPVNSPTQVATQLTSTFTPAPVLDPASPVNFDSQDRVPPSGQTTLSIAVRAGEVHIITAGPVCISGTGVCLPGGAYAQKRGSVVILLPRNDPYLFTGLVPLNNWHGSYYAQSNHAQQLAEKLAQEMMIRSDSNVNCTGGCEIIDVLIMSSDGVASSYTIQN